MVHLNPHHSKNTLWLLPITVDLSGIYTKFLLVVSRGNSSNSGVITLDQNPLLLWKGYVTFRTNQTFLCYPRIHNRGEETQRWQSNAFLTTKYINICIFPMVFNCFSLGHKGHDPLRLWAVSDSRRITNVFSSTCSRPSRGEETISRFQH